MADNHREGVYLEDCVVAAIETGAKLRESPAQTDAAHRPEKNFAEQSAANGNLPA